MKNLISEEKKVVKGGGIKKNKERRATNFIFKPWKLN